MNDAKQPEPEEPDPGRQPTIDEIIVASMDMALDTKQEPAARIFATQLMNAAALVRVGNLLAVVIQQSSKRGPKIITMNDIAH